MDEHTTERGEKPMADPVYAIAFIDDDPKRTDLRMAALKYAIGHTLLELRKANPGAHWRAEPQIERAGDRLTIRARLVS